MGRKYSYVRWGSGRVLSVGNGSIELKRSVGKKFGFERVLGGVVVEGVRRLGEKNVGNEEVCRIRKLVNEEEDKELFVEDVSVMRVWMRKVISDIIDKKEDYESLVK